MVSAMGNRKRAEPGLKVMSKREANATPPRFADAGAACAREAIYLSQPARPHASARTEMPIAVQAVTVWDRCSFATR